MKSAEGGHREAEGNDQGFLTFQQDRLVPCLKIFHVISLCKKTGQKQSKTHPADFKTISLGFLLVSIAEHGLWNLPT